ncbi:hypothetical protein SLS60_007251 [Paraconiothyrium brasiliense]|uniref:Cytochrome P450 n=1 Tax=Paraconiothyrium brasiliense TaxID=300254 RepID=A0ABR3R8V4_9PLEO
MPSLSTPTLSTNFHISNKFPSYLSNLFDKTTENHHYLHIFTRFIRTSHVDMSSPSISTDGSIGHAHTTRPLILFTAFVFLAVYTLRYWTLPKPIPGIPYRPEATRKVLGDIPDMLQATANSDRTYMQWIQEQMDAMNSPIIQMFIRPLSRPVLILADFRESQDILMRRKEWDRSDMLAELLRGLLPGHHLVQRTNSVWKSHRRLLQDLMSPPFLRNVAAPAVYHSASLLIDLWKLKVQAAGARPFSAQDDIFIAALDAVHAFAFGETFEYNATQSKLQTLEKLGPRAMKDLLRADATKSDEDAVEFPEMKLNDVISATLTLTAAVEKIQGSPLMRLTWKLMELTPKMRRARKIKDACILRELERAVDHLETSDQPRQDRGDKSQPAVRSAVDHMVQREKQLAEKENRAPQYFSPTMTIEVSTARDTYQ